MGTQGLTVNIGMAETSRQFGEEAKYYITGINLSSLTVRMSNYERISSRAFMSCCSNWGLYYIDVKLLKK